VFDMFGVRPRPDPGAAERVREWVREVLGLSPDTQVMVTELHCTEPDCPDVETVVAVLAPGDARKLKLLKPIGEVTREDVLALAAAGTDHPRPRPENDRWPLPPPTACP